MAQVTPASQLTITRASTATYVGANGTITTAAVNEPRYEFDPVALTPKGLLVEQASTNLFLNSAVAVTQTVTVVQGMQYSFSFWGTGSVVLSGGAVATLVGLGNFPAARVSNTFIATTTSVVVTITDSVLMAQLELGMPSSYIPTVGAAVTRAADVVNVDGVRYSNNAVAGQGTMYVNFEPLTIPKDTTTALSYNDGTVNNAIRIAARNSNTKNVIRSNIFTPTTDYFVGTVLGGTGLGFNGIRTNGVTTTDFSPFNGASTITVASGDYDSVNNVTCFGGTGDSFASSSDNGVTWIDRSISGGAATMGSGVAFGTRFIAPAALGFRLSTTSGTSWRRINVTGQTQAQNEIAYNGTTTLVSVGNTGTAYTSTDNGETWTLQSTGRASGTFSGITFGAGLFVAGITLNSTTAVSTSPDGVTWTTRTTPSIAPNDIAYNGTNLFVMVGSAGVIQTSPDGITWTARTSPQTAQAWTGVSFGNGIWTIVGNAGVVATSPDGINWTSRTSGATVNLQEVVYANFATNPLWIAVGSTGTIITSPDAITWTTRTSGVINTLSGVFTNNTTVIISGNNGTLLSSINGTTWLVRSNQTANINKVTFATNLWLVANNQVSPNVNFGYYDTSFNFTRLQLPTLPVASSNSQTFTYLNGKYYLAGTGYIATSTDLVNFTFVPNLRTDILYNAFTQNGDTVIVGTSVGTLYISIDNGVTFSIQSVDANTGGSSCTSLMFRDNKYIIVSLNGNICTSTDGLVWSRKLSSGIALRTLMYSTKENLYYVCGDLGAIYTSPDAETWTLLANRASASVTNAGIMTYGTALPNLKTGANKLAISFKSGTMSVALNGTTSYTKSDITVPTANRLSYGQSGAASMQLNGYIKDVQFFKQPLSVAELQAITL